jgi:hypothetical protein
VPWYAAVPFCIVFAFVLVLLHYAVSEALDGVDGDNGPFSRGLRLDTDHVAELRKVIGVS